MKLTGIDHVQIAMPQGQEAEARHFYGELLGLTEVTKPEPLAGRGGCWFEGANLAVHLGVQADFVPVRKAHPSFLVTDLAALAQRLVAADVPVQPDETLPEVQRFHTNDPFGNRLEFIQAQGLVPSSSTTEHFYDTLTPYYKLIFQDWEASIERQATALDRVIRHYIGPQARTVLDAACGIGTQSLGLARLGYKVTASDLSAQAVAQARREAAARQLHLTFGVADMRELAAAYPGPYEVVIACDNAVPHLLNEADILRAFQQFYHCLHASGGCLISVRDYAQMVLGGTQFTPRGVRSTDTGRVTLFDIWEFSGDYYDMTTYVIEDDGQNPPLAQAIRGGHYYCVTLGTLERLMTQAGFTSVQILRDDFFQPLVVGLKS